MHTMLTLFHLYESGAKNEWCTVCNILYRERPAQHASLRGCLRQAHAWPQERDQVRGEGHAAPAHCLAIVFQTLVHNAHHDIHGIFVVRQIDRSIDRSMYQHMHGCTDVITEGRMDGHINKWVGGWVAR